MSSKHLEKYSGMQDKLRIAILGSRGIPNNYGGFEQVAEYLSVGLVKRGHDVTVYNPHFQEYNKEEYNGVKIIKKWSPEKQIGSAANFIYDYICLKDAIRRKIVIILELGYQSASISYYLCDIKKSIVITNMDGMEWKRAKWNKCVKVLTKWFEKLAVKKSHYLVSDNIGIQKYIRQEYEKDSVFIPYGVEIFEDTNEKVLEFYGLEKYNYYLLIARLEPENNIQMILDGYVESNTDVPFVVIGNHKTKYGKFLKERYKNRKNILFVGGLYNFDRLNNLRYFSKLYFHGHSVGGTNPSLLEAMACSTFIVAHKNGFNSSVLGDDAKYFKDIEDIKNILNNMKALYVNRDKFIENNLKKIKTIYTWNHIINQYENLFRRAGNEYRINNSR